MTNFDHPPADSPRLDALLHALGASLRRDFDHTTATDSPAPNAELLIPYLPPM
ncbi:hypothetical protein [Mycobacterium paraterrae]|uniref:Uncharacterized protein n=1 Tax=Mycobacterium paraterrae TaxID=577492 RepID=A0ABY3VHD3_9MYCO|nr:hypothetical protein [Mycobacterium paraterrae]UMB68820.1 hypothetical protein MKK62_20835 [Mycobacterium paraterrae]